MNTETIYLVIIIGCLIMSAYFSASDTAFLVANKLRLKAMREAGNKRAGNVLKLVEDYDSLVSSILIGNNIVNILGASLTTVLCMKWFGEASGPSISTAVTTIVVLIFGEVTPKMIANEYPEAFAMFSCPVLSLLVKILTPFNFLFGKWKKFISIFFKKNTDVTTTEKELLMFVEETAQVGTITEDESDMIRNVINFSDLCVIDVFTPRVDTVAINIDYPHNMIDKIFKETGYSRIPVYDGNLDNVIGILNYKDYYNNIEDVDIRTILKPVKTVVGSKLITELMCEMKEERNHLSVVISEFGSMIGIVTLEDIIEELVGDIWDEGDDINPEIIKIDESKYQILGSTSLTKLSTVLNVEFESIYASTVNGLVMSILNRVPVQDEVVSYNNMDIKILSMNNSRINELELTIHKD